MSGSASDPHSFIDIVTGAPAGSNQPAPGLADRQQQQQSGSGHGDCTAQEVQESRSSSFTFCTAAESFYQSVAGTGSTNSVASRDSTCNGTPADYYGRVSISEPISQPPRLQQGAAEPVPHQLLRERMLQQLQQLTLQAQDALARPVATTSGTSARRRGAAAGAAAASSSRGSSVLSSKPSSSRSMGAGRRPHSAGEQQLSSGKEALLYLPIPEHNSNFSLFSTGDGLSGPGPTEQHLKAAALSQMRCVLGVSEEDGEAAVDDLLANFG